MVYCTVLRIIAPHPVYPINLCVDMVHNVYHSQSVSNWVFEKLFFEEEKTVLEENRCSPTRLLTNDFRSQICSQKTVFIPKLRLESGFKAFVPRARAVSPPSPSNGGGGGGVPDRG